MPQTRGKSRFINEELNQGVLQLIAIPFINNLYPSIYLGSRDSMLHDQKNTALLCPCGSKKSYNQCCEPAIEGSAPAKTAEQLMRSRYSAFALGMSDYIVNTTHPDYRQDLSTEILDQQNNETTWLQLTILKVESGSEQDDYGRVSFIAEFSADEQTAQLHENSRFSRIDGLWYYLDGEVNIQPS